MIKELQKTYDELIEAIMVKKESKRRWKDLARKSYKAYDEYHKDSGIVDDLKYKVDKIWDIIEKEGENDDN